MSVRVRPLTRLVNGLLAPAFVAWVCAVTAFRPELEALRREAALTLDSSSLVLLSSLAALLIAEAAAPWQPSWTYSLTTSLAGWGRLGRDVFYLLVVSQLTAQLLAVAVPTVGVPVWTVWPTQAPFALRVVLAFLCVELADYGYHRLAHRVPLLWRFHATHHVVTELSTLKAVRTHPVDNLLFAWARVLPAALLGAGAQELTAATFAGAALGLLAHANVDAAPGVLRWLVNVPRYHAVHHAADIRGGTHNFGCHTVLWDRVFATFSAGTAEPPVVGVEPVGPRSLLRELGGPFLPGAP